MALIDRSNRSKARKYRDQIGLRINFGSGPTRKDGFIGVDFTDEADLRLDLRRTLPFDDGCCSTIFTEHFIEHLSYPEGVDAFASECMRILEPGGEMLISVPDTFWPLKEYIDGGHSYLDACRNNNWHPETFTTFMEHINYHFRQRAPGESYSSFQNHRFAYDFETLNKVLREAGFKEISEREFDPALDSESRRLGSLLVRATKPS